ncbi:MAG: cytochrome c [Burkholderiales bacterium]|nr:c-type cytochrome [Burkholderiales bacterium]MDE1929286.1 cytochrome c [Burkholderiales bacterium]MDE2160595.1 cytochrome c [Burkholderiales bacterium]MDE2501900.1 cytochrome c [Burkholderiales bacterium]
MIKGFFTGVAATLVCAGLGGYLLLHSGRIPANADAEPGALETWMAKTSLHATLAREAPAGDGPVALTDANLLEGVRLYARNCAVCHGSARGDAAASPIAKGLYQKPPQLASDGVEDDPIGVSYWKIRHGIRLTGMPSFRDTLSETQIWTLALFVSHMDKLPPSVQPAWQAVNNWPVVAGQ